METEQLGKRTVRRLYIRLFFLDSRWTAKVGDKCLFDYDYLKAIVIFIIIYKMQESVEMFSI